MNICLDNALLNTTRKSAKERWEYIKYRAREHAMEYAKNKASEINLIIAQLSEKVTELESAISQCDTDLLERTKEDLNEFTMEKARACIFRSKVRYVELGEKPTKYFFNMEKARYNARTCDALYEGDDETNTLVTDTKGILRLQEEFYQNLYTADPQIKFNHENTYGIRVSDVQKEQQNIEISTDELGLAMKQLPNGKTCGNDGLPVEFYKVFWKKLKDPLLSAFRQSFQEGILFDSATLGILNLIPKSSKNSRFLKHKRPITVLNSDYKGLEKVIANRIEPALETIINNDQRGFMKSRRISANIRTIFELITHSEKENIEAIILSLDFMKCFDRIEFCALIGSLEFFNFSTYLIEWTKILYNNFRINIQNNGHFSNRITVSRGVHQGGPCSSLYFLICAETLALMLRENKQIEGIPVQEILNLLGQYADDADVFLKNDQTSLNSVFQTLEEFRLLSGFSLNYDKTTILRIGSLRNTDSTLLTQKTVSWTNEPINILGVWVSCDTDSIVERNYTELLQKANAVLSKWEHKTMSLMAKVLVVNSLIVSLFGYRMMALPMFSDRFYGRFKSLITSFIWNGRRAKIAYKFLIGSKTDGGLNLVDLYKKGKSLKLAWLQVLHHEPKLRNLVYSNIAPILKELIWECNLKKKHAHVVIKDKFWLEIMETWCELREKILSEIPISDQIIWFNSNILIENAPFFWSQCYNEGLTYISQLFRNGATISVMEAWTKYKLDFVSFNGILQALSTKDRKLLKENVSKDAPNVMHCFYLQMLQKNRLASYTYETLIPKTVPVDKIRKWSVELGKELSEEDFLKCFKTLYIITNIQKLRSFQYRLLHRAIVTNRHLKRWSISENDLCTFCQKETETYSHLFVMCRMVQPIWIEIEQFMMEFNEEAIDFNLESVILNKICENPYNIKNTICLMLKQFIYKHRCLNTKPSVSEFRYKVQQQRTIERYIASKHGKLGKHLKKWNANSTELGLASYYEMDSI